MLPAVATHGRMARYSRLVVLPTDVQELSEPVLPAVIAVPADVDVDVPIASPRKYSPWRVAGATKQPHRDAGTLGARRALAPRRNTRSLGDVDRAMILHRPNRGVGLKGARGVDIGNKRLFRRRGTDADVDQPVTNGGVQGVVVDDHDDHAGIEVGRGNQRRPTRRLGVGRGRCRYGRADASDERELPAGYVGKPPCWASGSISI